MSPSAASEPDRAGSRSQTPAGLVDPGRTGKSRRIPELDGVRGLAAIVVVLFHAYPASVFFWGWSGVELFFVLSGFLITTIIIEQKEAKGFITSFYLRRVLRIWPVYFPTLAGLLLLNRYSALGFATTGWLSHLFFLQNCQEYLGKPVPAFVVPFQPSWSVAVEEQYYVVWPLLVMACGRRSIPFFCAGLAASSYAGRWCLSDHYDVLFSRGDGLAMGCFLAWAIETARTLRHREWLRCLLWAAGAVGALYVGAFLVRFWMDQNPGWALTRFTGFALLYLAVVGGSVLYSDAPLLAPLRHPVLRWFGTVSYALYLFHLPIMTYTRPALERVGVHSYAVRDLCMWVLILALPAASWYLLERPIARWKENFMRSRPETEAIQNAAAHSHLGDERA